MEIGDYETASKKYTAVVEQMPFNFLGRFAQYKIDEIEWGKTLQPDIERLL